VQHCAKHPFEEPSATCRSCGTPFCDDCLVYAFGPKKPPFCVHCALVAAGIRRAPKKRGLLSRR
jgi:hypothetical protein